VPTAPENERRGFVRRTPLIQSALLSSDRESARNLYAQAADGTGPAERLTTSPNLQNATGVTPDGTRLLFTETAPQTGDDLLQVGVTGTRTRSRRWCARPQPSATAKPRPPHAHVPSDCAERLKRLRRHARLTQAQLALKIGGANKAVVYQWEAQLRKPSQLSRPTLEPVTPRPRNL
jgi:DNA-binding transcriptional regulator YiaG